MDSSQGHVAFHIKKLSIGKCLKYIFGYLLLMNFAKDCTFGSRCEKLGHASLPNLISTDPPPPQRSYNRMIRTCLAYYTGRFEKNW